MPAGTPFSLAFQEHHHGDTFYERFVHSVRVSFCEVAKLGMAAEISFYGYTEAAEPITANLTQHRQ